MAPHPNPLPTGERGSLFTEYLKRGDVRKVKGKIQGTTDAWRK
jgi:hypothetical protein